MFHIFSKPNKSIQFYDLILYFFLSFLPRSCSVLGLIFLFTDPINKKRFRFFGILIAHSTNYVSFTFLYMYSKFVFFRIKIMTFMKSQNFKESINASMVSTQLKFRLSMQVLLYLYLYQVWLQSRVEITTFMKFLKIWRKVFPLLQDPHSSNLE